MSFVISTLERMGIYNTEQTVTEEQTNTFITNLTSTLTVDRYDWSYAERPDMSEWVYIAATVYMVIIMIFGAVSNLVILTAFFAGPKKVRKI